MVRRRPGAGGRSLPTLELDIRDETGIPVPQGEPGENWVRGEQASGEYVGLRTPRMAVSSPTMTISGGSSFFSHMRYVGEDLT